MHKPKIVVVEDDHKALLAIGDALKSAGYEFCLVPILHDCASTEVVDQIKVCNPDLILMDEKLFTLRGFRILRELGGEFYKPNFPGGNPRVISISGSPCKETLALVGSSFVEKRYLDVPGYVERLLVEVTRCARRIR